MPIPNPEPGLVISYAYLGSLHESALSVRHLGRSMNGLRAGMSVRSTLDGWRAGGGRSHVSDVPRGYVYRASPEPPQSDPQRPFGSIGSNAGTCPGADLAKAP